MSSPVSKGEKGTATSPLDTAKDWSQELVEERLQELLEAAKVTLLCPQSTHEARLESMEGSLG